MRQLLLAEESLPRTLPGLLPLVGLCHRLIIEFIPVRFRCDGFLPTDLKAHGDTVRVENVVIGVARQIQLANVLLHTALAPGPSHRDAADAAVLHGDNDGHIEQLIRFECGVEGEIFACLVPEGIVGIIFRFLVRMIVVDDRYITSALVETKLLQLGTGREVGDARLVAAAVCRGGEGKALAVGGILGQFVGQGEPSDSVGF